VLTRFHSHDRGEWVVLEVTGDLDLATAPSLRQQVVGLLSDGRRRFVIDLTSAGYLDSIGLGMVVAIRKRVRVHDGEVEVVCPEPRLQRVFAIADLDRVFILHTTVDDAVSSAP
jgi:anti-sigma B factor antagonist